MSKIDMFMVFGELLSTIIMMFSHEYPLWERAFILAGSLFSAVMYFIMYFIGNNSPTINGIIFIIAMCIIIIIYWHILSQIFRQIWRSYKQVKISRMTLVQKQKYNQEQQAKQERKVRRKLKPTLKPGNDPETD